MELALIVLAFGPSLVWLYWLWSRDRFQREPLGLLLKLFFLGGIMSVGLTLLFVLPLGAYIPTEEQSPLLHMLFSAALPEELFKMLPVLLMAWRNKNWTEPFDGIVYAGGVALGFHMIESALYVFSASSTAESIGQGLIRGVTSGHMIYGVAMGYYLSHARFGSGLNRAYNLLMALAVPVALHTAWNTAILYGGSFVDGNLFSALIAWALSVSLWAAAFRYKQQARELSPFNPALYTVRASTTACPSCEAVYPEAAIYCQSCGQMVHAVARTT